MNTKSQIAVGFGAALIAVVLEETVPWDGPLLLIFVVVAALASVIRGPRLPLAMRVFATAVTFCLGYELCLVGRTMEPRFTPYTVQMALLCFGLYAGLPTLALLRIWRGRMRLAILASIIPFSLATAATMAAYEEWLFVREHPHGIGMTSRWTVSNHWLAYDAKTKQLTGSD